MRHRFLAAVALGTALGAGAATPASFPGGEEQMQDFLSKNIQYPARAQNNGIEGVVQLTFTVGPDGRIGKISVERPLDPDLESEAVRVVRAMPAWVPATDDNGAPVSQSVSLPVKFRLPAE